MTTLVGLLVCALVFIGFITNAVPWTPFNFGTLVVDILYVLIGCLSVLRIRSVDRERLKALRTPLILYAVYSAWCLFLMFYGDNSFRDRVMGFRNNVIYPGIWIPLALLGRAVSFRRVAAIIFYGGLASCVLAIIQAFFSADMPELLLTLHGTDKHFGFYGTDIFRVTGIVGNPLVFSGFSSFMVLLGYMFLSFEARRRARFLIWLPLIAMYYTYTRTSNVALLLTWGFAWSIWTTIPLWRRFVRIAFVLTFLAVMLFGSCFGPELFRSNFFFSRMSGTEITSQGSTEDHINAAIGGLAAWAKHPICGLGIGSQGYSVKDHTGTFGGDGAYLALLLETGGVGFVLAFVIMAWFLWRIMFRFAASPRAGPSFRMYGALLLTAGYFAMASVLNSAFTVRTNMCLYWILVGVMFSRPAGSLKEDDGRWGAVFGKVLSGAGGYDSSVDACCVVAGSSRFLPSSASLMALVRGVMKNRSLFAQMTKRNVEMRYRGSALGLVWSFVQPLMMLCVYTFVFSVVFKSRWGVDVSVGNGKGAFAVIMFCGMAIFNLFGEAINMSCGSIVGNPNLVKKVIFPLEILPVTQVATTFILGSAWFVLLFVGAWLILGSVHWTMLLLPIILIPLILFTLGISYFVASLGVFIRDTQYVIGVVLQVLFFATPIFYPINAVPERFRAVLEMNPLTVFIEQARNVFLDGRMPDWLFLGLAALVSLIVLQFGYYFFVKTKRGFADVL